MVRTDGKLQRILRQVLGVIKIILSFLMNVEGNFLMMQKIRSSTSRILYEHEMVRPEGKVERILRQVWGVIVIMLLLGLTYAIMLNISNLGAKALVLPLMCGLSYNCIRTEFTYNGKVRLIITETELLILAPNEAFRALTKFINLKISIRDIRDVSIKNTWSPEAKIIYCEQTKRFKVSPNCKSFWSHWYVFALANPRQVPCNIQFIYIESYNQKPLFIQFDDAQVFLCILKQQMLTNR